MMPESHVLTTHPIERRLQVEVHVRHGQNSTLDADVRRGLTRRPKTLPPKHFYDDVGSRLFDAICDTPEYYPTRTEQRLLERSADAIVASVRPTDVVELGSGAARKTRALLAAVERAGLESRYVPFDVGEQMLLDSSTALLDEHPWLNIHGVVGDYERHLDRIPDGDRRLFVFIGSTIGNFEHDAAVAFLSDIAEQMRPGDSLLLGTDLVKDHAVLEAAYNDADGLTADFNKNVLEVINRELGADFDLSSFEHRAHFCSDAAQIEMHLVATRDMRVHVRDLDLDVDFSRGETIRTEISRKFTRETVEATLAQAGLCLRQWHTPSNEYFALSLSDRA